MNTFNKISYIFALCLMSAFAQEEGTQSLSEQLGIGQYGEISGVASLYYQETTNNESTGNSPSFGLARLDLGFESTKWNGLQFGVKGVFNTALADRNDAYKGVGEDGIVANDAELAELYIALHSLRYY